MDPQLHDRPHPSAAATARLFIAAWPPPSVRAQLAARRDAATASDAAKVDTERLHMTLHFLGDVRRDRLSEVTDALAVPIESFELRFANVECWPGGLLVLVADAVPDPLKRLHAALRDAVSALSIPVDPRRFRPHVTLARRAHGPRVLEACEPLVWGMSAYVLVESRQGYRTLAEYPAS